MSYDLYCVHIPAGADPLTAARDAMDREEVNERGNLNEPDPAKEARKQALVNALINANLGLEKYPIDYAAIAQYMGISEREARKRNRHIELNSANESDGIQITLFDDTASITLAYWHQDADAHEVWQRIWPMLRILAKEGGYCIYDPQSEQIIDMSAGPRSVLNHYAEGVQLTTRIALDQLAAQRLGQETRRPWWMFWKS